MSHSYQSPSWSSEPSDDELQALAQQFFKTPKALHDIVLVRVPPDDMNCPIVTQRLQQEAIARWEARAHEDDLCLNIERRWIPHKCIFLSDTDQGREFQEVAEAIARIPMQAGVLPKNQNQAYWLKTQHYLYQARGLLIANQLFGLLTGDNHPRKLLQESVGIAETQKIEQLAAVDIALYKLIQAVAPKLGDATSPSATDPESQPLRMLVAIQEQAFVDDWNAGPANPENTWTSLRNQEDWHVKKIRFLRKLAEGKSLKPKEETYLQEIAQTGQYWKVLKVGIEFRQWGLLADYVNALTAVKTVCISDISWHRGEPYKLERRHEQEMFKPRHRKCSTVPETECDCPFRHIGTDLALSNCPKFAQQDIESPRRAHTPRSIKGTTNIQGYIIWTWA